jgi:surface antigen
MKTVQGKAVAVSLAASLTLSACATGQEGIGQAIGALVLGGACLALIDKNHQAACIAAAAAGFVVGGAIGHQLDERDKKRREQALAATLNNDNLWAMRRGQGPLPAKAVNASPVSRTPPSQDSVSSRETAWVNPDTQNSGRIEPLRAYIGGQNGQQECRQYRETYFKKGEPITDTVVECKNEQGNWVDQ